MSVSERVLRILEQVTRTPEVSQRPELPLYELQLPDSLSTVELMLALSRGFGLEISPADFDREPWSSPQRIIQDVETRLDRSEAGADARSSAKSA